MVHGDDFVAVGYRQYVVEFQRSLRERFEVRRLEAVQDPSIRFEISSRALEQGVASPKSQRTFDLQINDQALVLAQFPRSYNRTDPGLLP